jgi:hypothetical protein
MMWRGSVLDLNRPNIFIPTNPDNIIFSLGMNYEKMMLSFEENGVNARNFTVFQFEVALKKNEDDIKSMRNENKQG